MILTSDIAFGTASLYAVTGFAIVFFGLIFLMLVIWLMSRIVAAIQKKSPQPAAEAPAPAKTAAPAPGSAGEVALEGVTERDAAMIMAITANKMQKPLNRLRFISIREVK